jgi:16S rRNA processing protein RimM
MAAYDPRTIAIGVLGKPHGVRGEIGLRFFNQGTVASLERGPVVLARQGRSAVQVVTGTRPFGAGLLVTFAGVDSREAASALTHSEVRVERTTLPAPAPGEYFVSDVIGCEVINHDGARLGVVDEIFWNGAHDVMIVREGKGKGGGEGEAEGEGGGEGTGTVAVERMIPLVPEFIRAVDAPARMVRVEWQWDDNV